MIIERLKIMKKCIGHIDCFLDQFSRNYLNACVISLTFAAGALLVNPYVFLVRPLVKHLDSFHITAVLFALSENKDFCALLCSVRLNSGLNGVYKYTYFKQQ